MERIATFEKVSYEQFKKDYLKIFTQALHKDEQTIDEEIKEIYNNIELPKRATKGSAGYDFKIPFDIPMSKKSEYTIPTGIRCRMNDGWVLNMYPRSGLGFKRGLSLLNTVGIIDSDYYYSDNEGHIMLKVTHKIGDYTLKLNAGDGFAQGIFCQYGITTNDDTIGVRNGGFGSTDAQK